MSPSTSGTLVSAGALVLVVGPSGAGKDSLINAARARFRDDPRFLFPERMITRPAMQSAEDHGSLTQEDFDKRQACGEFALSWNAHGLSYAIPAAAMARTAEGQTMVVNVSRGVVAAAERISDRVTVLHVTAPVAMLAARIALRGRETEADIANRLARESAITAKHAKVVTIVNDGDLGRAVSQFCAELETAHVNATSLHG
jgi:ribose 1,5-bisphosphokinase